MTWRACAIAAAIGVVLLPRASWGQVPSADPEGEVEARERALNAAMHAKDGDGLDTLLAPDFVLRASPDIDRSTWTKNALALCWGDRSDIETFKARAQGQVVVASFLLTFYVDPAGCQPAVLRSLITDVWIREGDDWRLQVRHAGPPPDAGIAGQFGAVAQPPPTWELGGELAIIATGGNTSTRTIGAGSSALHRGGGGSTEASFAFLNSESEDVTRARSLSAQLRHGRRVANRLELFGEAEYGRDRFSGIDSRVAIAGGAAFTARLAAQHVLKSEGSFGFTTEDRLGTTRLKFATATGALAYKWTPSRTATLTQDVGVTADLGTPDNWRGSSVTAASVTLTRLLSLKASHAIEHRNSPVAGFKQTDMRTAVALVVSLQRR